MPKQALSAASTRSSKQDSRPTVRGPTARSKGNNSNQDLKGEDVKTDISSHLTEVDREWFNIKIRDLEDKLSRYRKI